MAAYLPRVVDEELDALLPALPTPSLEYRRLSSVTLSWGATPGKGILVSSIVLYALCSERVVASLRERMRYGYLGRKS